MPKGNKTDFNNTQVYLISKMLQSAFKSNREPDILIHDQHNEVINFEDVFEESASFACETTLTEKKGNFR